MNTTLVIMAAGIGSRFGGGIKQLELFAVINADDYYGKEAFVKVHDYLLETADKDGLNFCMAGFILKNTLSENGGVTRGVCKVDENFNQVDVVETHNIVKTLEDDGEVRAAVLSPSESVFMEFIDADSYVSMNLWGLRPEFMDVLEAGFTEFLSSLEHGDIKSKYLLPTIIDR